MSYSGAGATDLVSAVDRGELLLTWSGTGPFQVYVDRRLSYQGYASRCRLPLPPSPVRIDVGSIAAGDLGTDFSASLSLPPGGGNLATLTWLGGTYLGADIRGFHVYSGAAPGGTISYTTPVATVPAYIGQILDGFGMGGFGQGGFGRSASSYSWTSGPLAAGTWNLGIKSFDAAGNEGSPQTTTATTAGPPRAPAPFSDNTRLHKSYNGTSHVATLTWQASPTSGSHYHIYMNDGAGGAVDYTTIVSTVSALTYSTSALTFASDYTFAVRAFDPSTGYEESNTDARIRLVLNGSGVDVTARPNAPTNATAIPTVGAGVAIHWNYSPLGQGGAPTAFDVWITAGTSPGYSGSPAVSVPYSFGQFAYTANVSGLTDGTTYTASVRARNATATEPNVSAFATFVADSTGPGTVDSLAATVGATAT